MHLIFILLVSFQLVQGAPPSICYERHHSFSSLFIVLLIKPSSWLFWLVCMCMLNEISRFRSLHFQPPLLHHILQSLSAKMPSKVRTLPRWDQGRIKYIDVEVGDLWQLAEAAVLEGAAEGGSWWWRSSGSGSQCSSSSSSSGWLGRGREGGKFELWRERKKTGLEQWMGVNVM